MQNNALLPPSDPLLWLPIGYCKPVVKGAWEIQSTVVSLPGKPSRQKNIPESKRRMINT
jgi:hypothetical protein